MVGKGVVGGDDVGLIGIGIGSHMCHSEYRSYIVEGYWCCVSISVFLQMGWC
jgi:hypothetical protein